MQVLLMTVSGWVNRHQADVIAYLVEENRVLKGQMKYRALHLNDDQRRRLAALAKMLGRKALDRVATIVTPDTLMRWHHRLIALKWTYKTNRVGRPGLMKAIAALIVRMARENSRWGYSRIQGELKAVPDRPSSRRSFLKAHWGQVAATDFFTAEVWTAGGLKTYYVLFFIDLKTRRVHMAGVTPNPTDGFMGQAAVGALTFLKGCRFIIHDGVRKGSEA